MGTHRACGDERPGTLGHGGPPPALAKETPCEARVAGELRGMAPLQDLQPGRVKESKEAIKGTTTGILSRSLHLQDTCQVAAPTMEVCGEGDHDLKIGSVVSSSQLVLQVLCPVDGIS